MNKKYIVLFIIDVMIYKFQIGADNLICYLKTEEEFSIEILNKNRVLKNHLKCWLKSKEIRLPYGNNVQEVQVNDDLCVILLSMLGKRQIRCFMYDSKPNQQKNFNNPYYLSVSNYHICANDKIPKSADLIDNNSLLTDESNNQLYFAKCQYENEQYRKNILLSQEHIRPVLFQSTKYSICAVQTEKVKEITQFKNVDIKQYQTLKCWGTHILSSFNVPEELQNNEMNNSMRQIVNSSRFNFCAHMSNPSNQVFKCWGNCKYGICDVPFIDFHNLIQISVGKTHACVIISEIQNMNKFENQGHIKCWGEYNDKPSFPLIPKVFSNKQVTSVSAGESITCATKLNGFAKCWGNKQKYNNQFGFDMVVRQVSAGGRHSCTIMGVTISCFGNNDFGQLDIPNYKTESTIAIKSGWDQNCGVEVDNSVYCFGLNYLGQLDVSNFFTTSNQGQKINSIDVGLSHSCVLVTQLYDTNTMVICWGGNNEYQELNIETVGRITQVSTGDEFTCYEIIMAIFNRELSYIYCVGNNENGQLDTNTINKYSIETKCEQLESGGDHSCRLKDLLLCWGSNFYGQLDIPIKARAVTLKVGLGSSTTCAVLIQDNLNCWGLIGNPDRKLVLFQHLLAEFSVGWEHICIIDIEGRGECYGGNEWGQAKFPFADQGLI